MRYPSTSRRRFIALGSASVLAVAGSAVAGRRSRELELTEVSVPAPDERLRGLRVAFATDIHRSGIVSRKEVELVASMLADARPDLLLLGGDLVSAAGASEPWMVDEVASIFREVNASLGRLIVRGNHDISALGPRALMNLDNSDYGVLVNRGERFRYGGCDFGVAGVDDFRLGLADISSAGIGLEDLPTIVLSHNPDAVMDAERPFWFGLAGHLHGGQVRLPILGAPHRPTYYPHHFDQGWSRDTKTPVYVSRGTGVVTIPLRLFCRPEVVLVRVV